MSKYELFYIGESKSLQKQRLRFEMILTVEFY